MLVKCFASDTVLVLGQHTDFVGGRWSATGKFFFCFSPSMCSLQSGGLCVSLAALPTKWHVQYQLVEANVFSGVCVAKGVPLCVCVCETDA